MTTQIAPQPTQPEPDRTGAGRRKPSHEFVEYEQYIDQCVRRTQGAVRMVDFQGAVVGLLISLLSVMLVASLLDHWILPGGLRVVGRWFFLLLTLGVIGYFGWRRFWPMLFRRVNPQYAAEAIEHQTPSLKNSLLNFLLFRRNQQTVPTAVLEVIEQQAATGLSEVEVETSIDRSHLVRGGYVLLALLVGGAIYTLFSPKNPLQTVARVAAPWTELAVPSRVEISEVTPELRVIELPRGDHLTVSAKVVGIEDDPVTLFYTTEDGQIEDKPIEMFVPEGMIHYECKLPESEDGIQQNMTFRIEAGDARTGEYQIRVTSAPTINVESVHYEYPKYTGYASRTVENEGDLRAIEGTRVTIRAIANQRIDTASIDFDCDGRADQSMRIVESTEEGASGARAMVSFTLELEDDPSDEGKEQDRSQRAPKHASYQLRFKNQAGHRNRDPVRFTIDVTPDLAPTIEIRKPREAEVELPANQGLEIELTARDADFALARVALRGMRVTRGAAGNRFLRNGAVENGANLGANKNTTLPDFERVLLEQEEPGQFMGRFSFVPQEQGFKPGEVIEYWAIATDNKSPKPNVVETLRYRIRVLPPTDDGSSEEQSSDDQKQDPSQDKNQQPQDKQQEKNQDPSGKGSDNPQDEQQPGEKNSDEQEPNESQSDEQKPGDSNSEEKGESGADSEQSNKEQQQKPGEEQSNEPQENSGEEGAEEGSEQPDESRDPEMNRNEPSKEHQSEQTEKKSGEPQEQDSSEDQKSGKGSESGSKKETQRPEDDSHTKEGDSDSDSDSGSESGSEDGTEGGESLDKNASEQRGESAGQDRGKPNPNGERGSEEGGADNTNAQPSEGDEESESNEPVPGDGTNDGEAIERMKRFFDKQDDASLDDARDKARAERESDPEAQDSEQPLPEAQPNEQAAGDETDKKQQELNQQEATPGESGAEKDTPMAGQEQAGQEEASEQQANGKDSPMGQDPPSEGSEPTEGRENQPSGESPNSDPGETAPNQPKPGQQNKPKDQPGAEKPDGEKDPSGEAKDARESETEGQESGDRSGAGEEGKGQQSKKKGTGAAGSNEPADTGGETSNEPGGDRDSQQPGDAKQSEGKTGNSSEDQQGPGSESRPGEKGDSPKGSATGDEQQNPQGKPSDSKNNGDATGQPNSEETSSGDLSQNQGGGKNWNDGAKPMTKEQQAIEDKANLDYARKSTELVLEKLEDQMDKNQVDPELLDKLGWTEADMKRFVERWRELKDSNLGDTLEKKQATQELDERLRSLGLRKNRMELGRGEHQDKLRGMRETQRRPAPASLQERLKKYLRGTSRSKQSSR